MRRVASMEFLLLLLVRLLRLVVVLKIIGELDVFFDISDRFGGVMIVFVCGLKTNFDQTRRTERKKRTSESRRSSVDKSGGI